MNFKLVFRITGLTLLLGSATLVLPLIVALLYREDPTPFLKTILLMLVVGVLLSLLRPKSGFLQGRVFSPSP